MSMAQEFHEPDLTAVLKRHEEKVLRAMNCHQVGKIIAFDATKQTATVQIQMKRVIHNTQVSSVKEGTPSTPQVISYPVLLGVPVFVYTGGASYISMPVAVGDTCLVHFGDRDIDLWFENGAELEPNTMRVHDINDGFAVVGYRNMLNKLGAYDASNVVVYAGAGKIDLANAVTTMKAVLDSLIDAISEGVDTHGDSWNSGTLSALANAKTLMHTLLN